MMIFAFLLLLTFTTQQLAANKCIDLPISLPFSLCARLWHKTWETDYYGNQLNSKKFALLRDAYRAQGCDIESPIFLKFFCSHYAPECREIDGSFSRTFPSRTLCEEFMQEYESCYQNNVTTDCTRYPEDVLK